MGPDNARSHLESNSSAELGIQSEFRALRNMPSARKKKSAASTAASDLKSPGESPSGGDISRGTLLPSTMLESWSTGPRFTSVFPFRSHIGSDIPW